MINALVKKTVKGQAQQAEATVVANAGAGLFGGGFNVYGEALQDTLLKERYLEIAKDGIDKLIGKIAHALIDSNNWVTSHESK